MDWEAIGALGNPQNRGKGIGKSPEQLGRGSPEAPGSARGPGSVWKGPKAPRRAERGLKGPVSARNCREELGRSCKGLKALGRARKGPKLPGR